MEASSLAHRRLAHVLPLAVALLSFWLCASRSARAEVDCGSAFFGLTRTALAIPRGGATVLFQDLNGDGVSDRVVVRDVLAVDYLAADGSVKATSSFPAPPEMPWIGGPDSILFADIDGDTTAEIVMAMPDQVVILKAGTGGMLRVLGRIDGGPPRRSPLLAAGNFVRRTVADLVVESPDGSLFLYHFDAGVFSKGPGIVADGPSTSRSILQASTIVAADMDGDGLDDLLFPTPVGIGIARLGTRAIWDPFQTLPLSGTFSSLFAADFDGDRRGDVFVAAAGLMQHTWLQTSPGVFTPIPDIPGGFSDSRFLIGDLAGNGTRQIVGIRTVNRLVAGQWRSTALPAAYLRVSALVDLTADGVLDLVGQSSDDLSWSVLAGQRADISLSPTNLPASILAGPTAKITFAVVNRGPATVHGLAFDTGPARWRLDLLGCATDGTCPITLAVGETLTVPVAIESNGDKVELKVSVCSPVPDPAVANNAALLTIPTEPQADLSAAAQALSVQDNELVALFAGFNEGPSAATNVRLDVELPANSRTSSWQSMPTVGSCQARAGGLSCVLARLEPKAKWTVTVRGKVVYDGQALVTSASITSDVKDARPENNHDTETLPPFPGGLPASTGGACAIVPDGGWELWTAILACIAAVWIGRRRWSRQQRR